MTNSMEDLMKSKPLNRFVAVSVHVLYIWSNRNKGNKTCPREALGLKLSVDWQFLVTKKQMEI